MKWMLSIALLLLPTVAHAQSFEVSGAFSFTGGYGLGSASANETRNPSTGSGPLTLFQTNSRVSSAAGVDIRAGVYLTSRLVASAVFAAARPSLRTHATADFEGAPDVDAETSVSSHLIAGEIEYRVTRGPWVLIATGGAGQLREVPDRGDVLTSPEVHAGGGVRHALTHGRHPLGVRGDLVASYCSRSVGFGKHHVAPRAGAGLTFRF
jgi:hypothetical protein